MDGRGFSLDLGDRTDPFTIGVTYSDNPNLSIIIQPIQRKPRISHRDSAIQLLAPYLEPEPNRTIFTDPEYDFGGVFEQDDNGLTIREMFEQPPPTIVNSYIEPTEERTSGAELAHFQTGMHRLSQALPAVIDDIEKLFDDPQQKLRQGFETLTDVFKRSIESEMLEREYAVLAEEGSTGMSHQKRTQLQRELYLERLNEYKEEKTEQFLSLPYSPTLSPDEMKKRSEDHIFLDQLLEEEIDRASDADLPEVDGRSPLPSLKIIKKDVSDNLAWNKGAAQLEELFEKEYEQELKYQLTVIRRSTLTKQSGDASYDDLREEMNNYYAARNIVEGELTRIQEKRTSLLEQYSEREIKEMWRKSRPEQGVKTLFKTFREDAESSARFHGDPFELYRSKLERAKTMAQRTLEDLPNRDISPARKNDDRLRYGLLAERVTQQLKKIEGR